MLRVVRVGEQRIVVAIADGEVADRVLAGSGHVLLLAVGGVGAHQGARSLDIGIGDLGMGGLQYLLLQIHSFFLLFSLRRSHLLAPLCAESVGGSSPIEAASLFVLAGQPGVQLAKS
ncbi:hypothetical protein D3C78_789840 [compost metagenome]